MKATYHCTECGRPIVIEGRPDQMPDMGKEGEPLLCQRCDPAFSSLLDNKHHQAVKDEYRKRWEEGGF